LKNQEALMIQIDSFVTEHSRDFCVITAPAVDQILTIVVLEGFSDNNYL